MTKKRIEVEKKNVVLTRLEVTYVAIDDVSPNDYNPNRQSTHDFELLCKSISEDGFTQPIVVLRADKTIVDGEHRWRACRALGFTEVPVVLTDMTPEQMRIATLRHNRARGSEDARLAADVLKDLAALGASDWAQDSLMLDDIEVDLMMKAATDVAAESMEDFVVPETELGPDGTGPSEYDKTHDVDQSADRRRAQEDRLQEQKLQEERAMAHADNQYRLILHFTGEEAVLVNKVLGKIPSVQLLAICREEYAAQADA